MRVLIVDAVPLLREGLKVSLSRRDGSQVVGEASTLREALQLIEIVSCDVVLLDPFLPDCQNLIEPIAALKRANPTVPILVFAHPNSIQDDAVLHSIQAGADGFLVKTARMEELIHALVQVAAGTQYLHPSLAGPVMKTLEAVESPDALTTRQEQVLALAVKGYSNQAMAEALHISLSSVKGILRTLFAHFEVGDRTQLVLKVVEDDALRRRLERLNGQPAKRRRDS